MTVTSESFCYILLAPVTFPPPRVSTNQCSTSQDWFAGCRALSPRVAALVSAGGSPASPLAGLKLPLCRR